MKSMIIYLVIGLAAGLLSGTTRVPLQGLFIAAIILGFTSIGLKYLLKADGYKWLLSNGIVSYVTSWYVSFTIMFNLGV